MEQEDKEIKNEVDKDFYGKWITIGSIIMILLLIVNLFFMFTHVREIRTGKFTLLMEKEGLEECMCYKDGKMLYIYPGKEEGRPIELNN